MTALEPGDKVEVRRPIGPGLPSLFAQATEGRRGEVLDVRENVGTEQRTWVRVYLEGGRDGAALTAPFEPHELVRIDP